MDLGKFQELLICMYRQEAGAAVNPVQIHDCMVQENPSAVVNFHLDNVQACQSPELVAISIINLKRIFKDGTVFDHLAPEMHARICTFFPNVITSKSFTEYLLGIFVDACVTIVPVYLDHGMMGEFITALVVTAAEFVPGFSSSAIDCLTKLYSVIDDFELINLETVLGLVGNGIGTCPEIAFACIRLLFECFVSVEMTPQFLAFAEVLLALYDASPPEMFAVPLSDLYIFCMDKYSFFEHVLPNLVQLICGMLVNIPDEQIKTLAVQILVCLAKNFDLAFAPLLQPVTAALMTASCCVTEQSIIEEDFPYSDDSIFLLSEIFSTRTPYPALVVNLCKEMAGNQQWEFRRSVMIAIHRLLASAEMNAAGEVSEICDLVYPLLGDQHPLVRQSAHIAFREICREMCHLLEPRAKETLELVINILKGEPLEPVRVDEVKGLAEFCRNCPQNAMIECAPYLMPELQSLLQHGLFTPLEQIILIKCMTAIATVTEYPFVDMYPVFMTNLKSIYTSLPPGEDNPLRIQVIETFPVVLGAVDVSLCSTDVREFLGVLISTQLAPLGDNERIHTLAVWVRIAESYPDIFAEVLGNVLEILCDTISQNVETEVFPGSCDLSQLSDRVWMRSNGNEIISYYRAQLNLILAAIETVTQLVAIQKEQMLPFAETLARIIANYSTFDVYPSLQKNALLFLQSMIQLYKRTNPEALMNYTLFVRENTMEILAQPGSYSRTLEIVRIAAMIMTDVVQITTELGIADANTAMQLLGCINDIMAQSQQRRAVMLVRTGGDESTAEITAENSLQHTLATLFTALNPAPPPQ